VTWHGLLFHIPSLLFRKQELERRFELHAPIFVFIYVKEKRGNSKALICERGNGSPDTASLGSWVTSSFLNLLPQQGEPIFAKGIWRGNL
jgi:hypothetical protein